MSAITRTDTVGRRCSRPTCGRRGRDGAKGAGVDPSFAKYGTGGLHPAWEPAPTGKYSPLWHYPYTQAREARERLAADGPASPFDGVILEYTNSLTSGPAILFSHTDVPVMRALDLYREEAHPAGR